MKKPATSTATGLHEIDSLIVQQLRDISTTLPGAETITQRSRLLLALKRIGSLTTIDIRRYLDVLCPAPRIMELRRKDWNIVTTWDRQESQPGKVHRIGRYTLHSPHKIGGSDEQV